MKLIECVPNFSEGRNRQVIDALASVISAVETVSLLEVDPGADTNRTVYTFVGSPDAVVEAAFRSIRTSAELIDMRLHRGAHPRLGACDVCPLVPLRGVEMAECVRLARNLGRRVADELGIPVYLYGHAARSPARRELAAVRHGEYEGLPGRIGDPRRQPDFGRLEGCEKTGATIIGAREFLIAINFNLSGGDRALAHDIACDIREAGRVLRDGQGRILRRRDGTPRRKSGRFKRVKALGWTLPERQLSQVSVNLTDYRVTPLAELFLEVSRQAERRGVRCTGSELVGLIPLDCLLQAGRYFLRQAGKSPGLPERQIIETAIRSLGLSDLEPFEPARRIIEYRIAEPRPLIDGGLRQFVDAVSSDSPAPGGGSVAATCGALAAALTSMVANLTCGRKNSRKDWPLMQKLAERSQLLKDRLLQAVDDDTDAFRGVMSARRPKASTPEEKTKKAEAVQAATLRAIEVPLGVLRSISELLPSIEKVIRRGNPQAITDAAVALWCARAAAEGACYNVQVNLPDLADRRTGRKMARLAQSALAAVRRRTTSLDWMARARMPG